MKPHRSSLILALGILSLIICAPLGVVAWVMGSGDLKEMDVGRMDPAGRSNTQAGKICGMISTVLMLLAFAIVLIFFALGLVAALASHH